MNTLVRENRSSSSNGERAAEQFIAPAATVLENADGYTLEVEMPGVSKENLEMWIENSGLPLLGRRSMPAVEGMERRPRMVSSLFSIHISRFSLLTPGIS